MPFGSIAGTLRTRAALGLRPITAPVMVFVPIGAVLGPQLLDVLSAEVLGHLDVVVSIALATLGVFIGIAAGRGWPSLRRLFAAATAEAAVTIAIVSASLFVLANTWGLALGLPYSLVALSLGICASASAAPATTADDEGTSSVRVVAARVADLDDVLPIVLGGVIVVLVAGRAGSSAAMHTIAGAVLGAAIAAAGLLLVGRNEDVAERGVFVLGMLALLGGCAAHLGMSPLLTGLAAGLVWALSPGRTDLVIAQELAKVQHPLVVLLLLIAGASPVPTLAALWLFAPYVVFRLAGKLLGSWAASRIAASVAPSDLGVHLIAPGVIGIAFALNLQQVAPDGAGALLFAVAVGAVASELLSVIIVPPPAAR